MGNFWASENWGMPGMPILSLPGYNMTIYDSKSRLKIPWIYLSLSPHCHFIFSTRPVARATRVPRRVYTRPSAGKWLDLCKRPMPTGSRPNTTAAHVPTLLARCRPVVRSERTVRSQPKSLQSLRDDGYATGWLRSRTGFPVTQTPWIITNPYRIIGLW